MATNEKQVIDGELSSVGEVTPVEQDFPLGNPTKRFKSVAAADRASDVERHEHVEQHDGSSLMATDTGLCGSSDYMFSSSIDSDPSSAIHQLDGHPGDDDLTQSVSVEESFSWLSSSSRDPLDADTLASWSREGSRLKEIGDQTQFCQQDIILDLLQAKSVFKSLDASELRGARARSNPFELIRGGPFLNRAAMKMANMDARLGFIFSNPLSQTGSEVVGDTDLLYFADVCSGPGGFSEYLLWRRGWRTKGFGFTLRGPNDFNLHNFLAGSAENFEPHYGEGALDGDGDIFRDTNQTEFCDFVLRHTSDKGVHLMMADGGFDVTGNEGIQEILSKQLYLCQCLVALNIVRPGGHFVCKLFDVFTTFSVGLIYLMYRSFEHICLLKPNTSRPANAERYLVCKWRRERVDEVRHYLRQVNLRLEQLGPDSELDVLQLVPEDVLWRDAEFNRYIIDANNTLGLRQLAALRRMAAFCLDLRLREDRQLQLRRRCQQLWQLPSRQRRARDDRERPSAAVRRLQCQKEVEQLLSSPATPLLADTLGDQLRSLQDWRFLVCGAEPDSNNHYCLLLGLGSRCVWRASPAAPDWRRLQLPVELPTDSLLLAELVTELSDSEPDRQRRRAAVHLLDPLLLAGQLVHHLPLQRRGQLLCAFVESISRATRPELAPLRVKPLHPLSQLSDVFSRLELRRVKSLRCAEALVLPLEADPTGNTFYRATGMMLISATSAPWMTCASPKSETTVGCFNRTTNESPSDGVPPEEAVADCSHRLTSRLQWTWSFNGVGVLSDVTEPGSTHTRQHLLRHVQSLTHSKSPVADPGGS